MGELDAEAKSLIELEVRRIMSSDDFSFRTSIAGEAKSYREFLQSQFQAITIGVTTFAIVGSGLFIWFFSQSVDKTQQEMISTVNQKMIDYRIVDEFKKRISEIVELEASGPDTTKIVKDQVGFQAASVVESVANKKIDDAISGELSKLKSLNPDDILLRASMPAGAIVAFANPGGCPNNWELYTPSIGRFVVGAGQPEGTNITARAFKETGGSDSHQLTIEELPSQTLAFDTVTFGNDWYNAGGRDYRAVGSQQRSYQFGGSNKQFSIMPPYIALYLCRKV